MKQSFRLESRIFCGGKEKRNFENIALLFPRTAPHSYVFWEGHADSASQLIQGGWFFQFSIASARSLLNIDKFCFYLVFCSLSVIL